jgi:hypothetical protein
MKGKRKKPDRLGVLVGEICLIQYGLRRRLSDAKRMIADLEAIDKHLDRLREENRERV